jgi:hypothetical protein
MATTTLAKKQQTITVSGTSENDINFNDVLKSSNSRLGYALITMVSGTAVQFDSNDVAIGAGSIALSATGNITKEIFEIQHGVNLRYKGGAGSEVFNISIIGR